MSKRFPPESILKFQKVCKALKKRGHLERTGGLCFALDRLGSDQAYEIMSTLLTGQQHFEGLGPRGEFTEDRKNFLDLLIIMSPEDYP